MDYTLLRKITVKAVYGDIERPKETDKPVDVMHVIGNAFGVRELEDKYKPGEMTYALRGDFEAVNIGTGEVFRAPEVFLPEPTQSMIVDQIRKGATDIQFALSISFKFSKTAVGYEYVTKPHVKPSGVDLLAELRASLPQIAAPVIASPVKEKGKKAA
jgi:hypothetical protein